MAPQSLRLKPQRPCVWEDMHICQHGAPLSTGGFSSVHSLHPGGGLQNVRGAPATMHRMHKCLVAAMAIKQTTQAVAACEHACPTATASACSSRTGMECWYLLWRTSCSRRCGTAAVLCV